MSGGGKGGGKGGGSSGSVEVDVNSNSQNVIDSTTALTSTSNMSADTRSQNNIDSTANATLQLAGLDNIRLRADTTSDNKTALDVDLKPLQVDLCLKVGLDRLPPTRICQPTHQRFGLSLFGVEVLGLSYSKEQDTVIEDGRQRPFVAGDAAAHAVLGPCASAEQDHSGVRIRLGD